MTQFAMLKKPTAFLPAAMSLAALATVLVYVATVGIVRQPDEGTAAPVFLLGF